MLDEITEMPLSAQVRLLRVLDSGVVQPIGGTRSIQTDVRLLAATNRSPRSAIRDGKLRDDLYFRLASFTLYIPRLRDRAGDIELLAQLFLDEQNLSESTIKQWATGALETLGRLPWRGNVRELRSAVRRAYILADDGRLSARDATTEFDEMNDGADVEPSKHEAVDVRVGSSIAELERELICATLSHVGGDKVAAAKILGVSLRTVYSRLNVYSAEAKR